MKSAVETLEPTRVKVTVEAPYEELKAGIDAAYRDIANQVNVPGFRRGKVPARIIDQRVGRGVVIEQAVNEAVPALYREAMAENDLRALGSPDIDVTEVPAMTGALGGQLVFTAEVDIRPEFELPEVEGLSLQVDAASVTDEDVENRLTALRERFGSLTGVDRAAAAEDYVVIDLEATVEGEEVESVSGISHRVGAGDMIDGLDDALVGMKAGDSKTFTTRLVAGEHADKDAQVKVTVSEVKVRELPEADDDFAQLASEFDTIAELREDLRAQVARDKTANQAVQARERLLDHLRANVEFPLPQRVIDAEVQAHLEREGKEQDDPHGEEIREETERGLRDQLLLDALAERFAVRVGQEELLQYMFTTAQQYGVDPSEFITSADQSGQIPAFVSELARNKSLVVALRRTTVTDDSGAGLDLKDFVGEDSEEEAAAIAEAAAKAAERVAARAAAPAKKAPARKSPAKKTAAKKADAAEESAAHEAGAGEEPEVEPKRPARRSPAKKAAAAAEESPAEAGAQE